MLEHADQVQACATLVGIPAFQEAIESDTAGMPHTVARFTLWGELLADAIGQDIRGSA